MGNEHIGLSVNQFLCRALHRFRATSDPAVFDPNIASFDPTQLSKPLLEGRCARLRLFVISSDCMQRTASLSTSPAKMDATENHLIVHGLYVALPSDMKNFPVELIPLP
jgi:hypothetical protein